MYVTAQTQLKRSTRDFRQWLNTHVHRELFLKALLTKCRHVLINFLCYPEKVGGHSYLKTQFTPLSVLPFDYQTELDLHPETHLQTLAVDPTTEVGCL